MGVWQSNTSLGQTYGCYGSVEKRISNESTVFLRSAIDNGIVTVVPFAFEVGILRNTPFLSRKNDIFSAGIAQACFKDNKAETAYEVTYLWQHNKYIAFQPDLQYIQHLSGLSNNAMIAIFRVIIAYDN